MNAPVACAARSTIRRWSSARPPISGRVSISRYNRKPNERPSGCVPEYAAIHSHVLQDVLARLDKTYQAFFRRVQRGEKAGFPRYQGRNRYHS